MRYLAVIESLCVDIEVDIIGGVFYLWDGRERVVSCHPKCFLKFKEGEGGVLYSQKHYFFIIFVCIFLPFNGRCAESLL